MYLAPDLRTIAWYLFVSRLHLDSTLLLLVGLAPANRASLAKRPSPIAVTGFGNDIHLGPDDG